MEGTASTILTHWGRVTHICVVKLTIIGSDNGLSPGRHQAIIWTNAGILSIGPLGTNFSEIWNSFGIQTSSFKKMHLKMSSANRRPFCLGLNVLNIKNNYEMIAQSNGFSVEFVSNIIDFTVVSAIFLQSGVMEYPNVHISELFIEFLWVDVVYDVRTVWSVVEWSDWEAGPGNHSNKYLPMIFPFESNVGVVHIQNPNLGPFSISIPACISYVNCEILTSVSTILSKSIFYLKVLGTYLSKELKFLKSAPYLTWDCLRRL